jgi:tetratricopeptide (TPR) repeat protein
MAFGFGFNKQKVLSAAEKYVQQGKIQNAISEYEKVTKADPKDLTVTNTIGDLYSRLGEADKATECFKTVGDAYANQGFTVKAIAMYKKISKLKPSLESVLKLAELYTQQGLFNDARAQYLQVAEEFLKSGELDNAVRIFHKILEMDPENTNMRVRLAEVYVRLGKKEDAWKIFSAAAETLRSKGSLSGAEEVLQRMLTLDPGNSYALLMQGRNLLENGDAEAAADALQKVPDLDSNPEGLRDLLKAYLKTGRLSDAGTLASKLLTVHNDLAAISTFADALMQAGQHENALQVYDQHAERLLAEDSDRVLKNLHTIIGHVRDNPASLEKLLDLFQKAGESTHLSEVIELLAHASVQSGDLARARDLYQKLATVEPGNPLHMNNYQQVVNQLGGDAAEKLISAEEAAVIVDELEATAPSIHQHYPDAVALAVRSALTDAELFISYNMPAKALGPLMVALPLAPTDLRLNQRLAALHTRAARFAEAGVCCRTLQNIYSEAEYPEEATRYGELATRYEERSAVQAADAASISPAIDVEEATAEEAPEEIVVEAEAAPWPSAQEPEEEADNEFAVVSDQDDQDHDQVRGKTAPVAEVAAAEVEVAAAEVEAAAAEVEAAAEEIDLSSEWDDAITVEADMPAAEPEVEVAHQAVDKKAAAIAGKVKTAPEDSEKTAETVEEIRFYLEHGMPEQAEAAFEKLQTLTSNQATLASLRSEIELASQQSPAANDAAAVEAVSNFVVDEPVVEPAAEFAVDENPPEAEEFSIAVEEPTAEEPAVEETAVEEVAVEQPAVEEIVPQQAEAAELPAPNLPEPVMQQPVPAEPVAAEPAAATAQPAVLQEFVADLESSLGEGFIPGTVPHEVEPEVARPELEAIGQSAPTVFGVRESDSPEAAEVREPEVMGEFVADLEASLGDDFLKGAPVAESEAAPQPEPEPVAQAPVVAAPAPPPLHVSASTPAPAVVAQAATAAAASSGRTPVASSAPVLAQPPAPSAAAKPPVSPIIPSAPAAAKVSPFGEEAGVDLAEMFGELKHDLEAGTTAADEDPETHYNLGIAFREMGLLDEAIGELQKTCQAVDRGHPFPQVMQTYTWLAQCFLDKGVPEAAIRWYEKALVAPGIDEETRTALHYELAGAHEMAGDKSSALKHFMEVYGRNIDYRDVAERIKALKS